MLRLPRVGKTELPVIVKSARNGIAWLFSIRQTRKWEDNAGGERYTTEIVLQNYNGNLVLLDGRSDGVPAGGDDVFASPSSSWDSSAGMSSTPSDLDDDIPF